MNSSSHSPSRKRMPLSSSLHTPRKPTTTNTQQPQAKAGRRKSMPSRSQNNSTNRGSPARSPRRLSMRNYFSSKREEKKRDEDDGSISSKSSYHSAGQSERYQSAVMELSDNDKSERSSQEEAIISEMNVAHDTNNEQPPKRLKKLPAAPEGNGADDGGIELELARSDSGRQDRRQPPQEPIFSRARGDGMSQSMPPGVERRGHALSKSLPPRNILAGEFKSAPFVETAPALGLSSPPRLWQGGDTTDEEEGGSYVGSSNLDLDDNTITSEMQARGSLYLKNLSLSPAMKGVLGLAFSLLIVVPLAFAGGAIGESSNDADAKNTTNTTLDNSTRLSNLTYGDEFLEPFTDREFASQPATIRDRLIAILPNETISAAQESGTPQNEAYHWLLQDPLVEEYQDWELQQRMAMATFYYAFDGPNWDQTNPQARHWMLYNQSECDWMPPMDICHSNGTVAQISINNLAGFQGSMPPEIGLLTNVQAIHFGELELALSTLVVSNLLELESLASFECIQCQGKSEIPTTIGEYLPNLQHLDLSLSQLSGSMPSQLGLLTLLTSLNLKQNDLTEEMPANVWEQWTAMRDLDLSGNKLTGIIPSTMGAMTSLQSLDIKGGNRFMGNLPSELGLLSSLLALKMGGNRIGGSLPQQLGRLTNLDTLGLSKNQFTGSIPWLSTIVYLTKLSSLSLGDNEFVGSLPPDAIGEMANHTKLHTLDLSSNGLDGVIPSEVGVLTALTALALNDNGFTGELPSELALLTDLAFFNVEDNVGLEEDVPEELCNVAAFNFSDFQFGWCEGRAECCAPQPP